MVMADLFPPGRVLWAIRDGDLIPSQRLSPDSDAAADKNKVRLFEVEDVEKVFGQIIFARDMLRSVFNNSRENGLANGVFSRTLCSSHLPHQYDRVLHELL